MPYHVAAVKTEGYDHSWHEAFLGMANALRQADDQLEWWPTEGTLIALMRYGESGQKLCLVPRYVMTNVEAEPVARLRTPKRNI